MLLDEANHVMKDVAANDRGANLRSYADPDLPLAEGLIDAISDFIEASATLKRWFA